MSDFDAEAERERLREKYEAEEDNRKRTQQMSELLLKGATMTNRHCGECGSPIFRYQEQEFCPSCQRTIGDGTDAADAESDAGGGSEADPGETAADATTGPAPGAEPVGGAASNGIGGSGGAATEPDRASDPERAGGEEQAAGSEPTAEGRPTAAPATTTGRDGAVPTRQAARESLLAALTRHAELAADTDEPRRATDHLEAAREAAAALDELDGS